MKNGTNIEEAAANFEQKIEQRAYDAVQKGVRNAMSDLGFGDLLEEQEQDEQKTMQARRRSREGRKASASRQLQELTKNQEEVLQVIQDYFDEHGQSPKYKEIEEELGKSGVGQVIHSIEKKGWLKRDNEKHSRKLVLKHRL